MIIVVRAVIPWLAHGGFVQHCGQLVCPFPPGKRAGFAQSYCQCEGLCLGSANTGPSASRGMPSAAANAATPSDRLKVVLPQIETDAIARTGGIAPKRAGLELDGIERLRIFPLELSITVGEHVRAMQGNDYALFVTCIARQARVRLRMDIAGAHRIAGTVSRLTFSTSRGRAAAAPELDHHRRLQRRRELGGIGRRTAAFDLLARHEAVPDRVLDQPEQPPFVIARTQVISSRHPLLLMSAGIDVPTSPGTDRVGERVHSPFPRFVEDRLVLLDDERPETVHAPHVVHAVHRTRTRAVPTMASRVTSAASCSSLMFSVAAGRSGK